MCPLCYNEACKIGDPLLESKYPKDGPPTIQELNDKHERIVAELIKVHEIDKEIFHAERTRWTEERNSYEVKIESLRKTLGDLFTAHEVSQKESERIIRDLNSKLIKSQNSGSAMTEEEMKEIQQQITEKEEQIRKLELDKVIPDGLSSAPSSARKTGVTAPTAASMARQLPKKRL